MDAWWGDRQRRQRSLTLATTMYTAGTGDPAALPGLASLAVDRTEGAVVRASALEYIGRLAGARVIDAARCRARPRPNARSARRRGRRHARGPRGAEGARARLFGAASDPEPMVRAAAVRTLGTLDQRDERVLAVLTARLVDEARVVRARAAESLLALDVVTAPARVGEALGRAQLELAESLRSFPESRAPAGHPGVAARAARRGGAGRARHRRRPGGRPRVCAAVCDSWRAGGPRRPVRGGAGQLEGGAGARSARRRTSIG